MALLSVTGLGMLVMTGFLALAAVVQINDPDPLIWMTAYGLPSVLTLWACLVNTRSGLWRALCDLVLVGLILFAATVVYPVIKDGNVGNLVSTEEGREAAGLVLTILWLFLLLFQGASWFSYGLLAFAMVPPSLWLGYKYYIQHTLSLPEHCEGLL